MEESNEGLLEWQIQIDNMTHYELCKLWRFGKSDNELFQGEKGEYLRDRLFNHFGGFNPEISKSLGWNTQ